MKKKVDKTSFILAVLILFGSIVYLTHVFSEPLLRYLAVAGIVLGSLMISKSSSTIFWE